MTDFFYLEYIKMVMTILQVVKKCNEGARRMQQTEQMCLVVQNLEFKVKVKYIIMSRSLTNIIDYFNDTEFRSKVKSYMLPNKIIGFSATVVRIQG